MPNFPLYPHICRNDIRIYLQKVIHLEYEHANNVDAVHSQGERYHYPHYS